MTHEELKRELLSRPDVRAEYLALGPEFQLLRQMLAARKAAGLTQAEVAERMGTKAPAVTRLESSLSSGHHSPSLSTLSRYADAVGCDLEVRLIRKRHAEP